MRSCVNVHVHRVSGRLGLIGKKVSANAAHDKLVKPLCGVSSEEREEALSYPCQKSQPGLWVDTHVHRCSIRLGLIGKKVTADNAHDLLQALLPQDARTIYNFHKALLRHGQRICVYDRPRCYRCAVTDLCDYYKTVVWPKITGQPSPPHVSDE
jgi:endonuclease III